MANEEQAANEDTAKADERAARLSRRTVLLAGATGAAAFASSAVAQKRGAPAIAKGAVAGMPFRAFVRHGTQGTIEDLKLREIGPTQVLVRSRGSCCCYTVTTSVLGNAALKTPTIPNHSGMGIVEAIGAQVRRVRVGDRVLVSGTPWCGHCAQCLSGTPEWCNYLAPGGVPNDPIADMADGTGVIEAAVIGGLSEIIVGYEEYCVPIFSELPDAEIAMLGDTGAVGIASTSVYDPVQIGQNVVIFGAGPIGLAAVQGARAQAAGKIIVVEPVRYRREKALQFGATTVLDPNESTGTLVERIREMCAARTDRLDAGGQVPGNSRFAMRGADLVVEASGLDRFPPAVEVGTGSLGSARAEAGVGGDGAGRQPRDARSTERRHRVPGGDVLPVRQENLRRADGRHERDARYDALHHGDGERLGRHRRADHGHSAARAGAGRVQARGGPNGARRRDHFPVLGRGGFTSKKGRPTASCPGIRVRGQGNLRD